VLVAIVAMMAGPMLCAATAWESEWRQPRAERALFEVPAEAAPVSYDHGSFLGWAQDQVAPGQAATKKRETTQEKIGVGASLGINYAAIGIGLGFFAEYYPLPMLAVGAHMSVAYGALGSPYESNGDGLAFAMLFGARFVVDFDTIEITRWLRPFVAFYPFGFAYFSGTEEFDVPGTGNTDDITYTDIFFLTTGGFGSDFYITPQIGVGVAIYIYGTIGGSKHEKRGFELETEGSVGVYVEYVRLSFRF
jgi:hypothetical protein